jgi:hypothetical protein
LIVAGALVGELPSETMVKRSGPPQGVEVLPRHGVLHSLSST